MGGHALDKLVLQLFVSRLLEKVCIKMLQVLAVSDFCSTLEVHKECVCM